MDFLNWIVTGFFRLLFWPLGILPPLGALTVISVVTGAIMVWIFGRVSSQERIRLVKDRIRGNLFGVRLYQHEIGVVLRLQRQIFRDTFTYMTLSVVPMLVLMIPVFLIIVQLNLYFGNRPLRPGEQAMVRVEVTDPSLVNQVPVSLKGAPSFTVETPPVHMISEKEIAWRIRAVQAGQHSLAVQIGNHQVAKNLEIGEKWGRVSTLRTTSWLDSLLYPAEERLDPRTGIRSIEIVYRPLPLSIMGLDVDWLVFFFAVSVVASFALKGVFGVQL
ncbi:MAG: hypothetical protein EHM61_18885 [Acidobacteria bacterium]|nr:MAG: hypothetical protein EHM61_18885 [Acidobacteriota bacterium]